MERKIYIKGMSDGIHGSAAYVIMEEDGKTQVADGGKRFGNTIKVSCMEMQADHYNMELLALRSALLKSECESVVVYSNNKALVTWVNNLNDRDLFGYNKYPYPEDRLPLIELIQGVKGFDEMHIHAEWIPKLDQATGNVLANVLGEFTLNSDRTLDAKTKHETLMMYSTTYKKLVNNLNLNIVG